MKQIVFLFITVHLELKKQNVLPLHNNQARLHGDPQIMVKQGFIVQTSSHEMRWAHDGGEGENCRLGRERDMSPVSVVSGRRELTKGRNIVCWATSGKGAPWSLVPPALTQGLCSLLPFICLSCLYCQTTRSLRKGNVGYSFLYFQHFVSSKCIISVIWLWRKKLNSITRSLLPVTQAWG